MYTTKPKDGVKRKRKRNFGIMKNIDQSITNTHNLNRVKTKNVHTYFVFFFFSHSSLRRWNKEWAIVSGIQTAEQHTYTHTQIICQMSFDSLCYFLFQKEKTFSFEKSKNSIRFVDHYYYFSQRNKKKPNETKRYMFWRTRIDSFFVFKFTLKQ